MECTQGWTGFAHGRKGRFQTHRFCRRRRCAAGKAARLYFRVWRVGKIGSTHARVNYAHASVGLLHVRPMVNLKEADEIAKMRFIAESVRDLVMKYGGAVSGEHGDGLVRSCWNETFFGAALYAAFREVKRAFDPKGLMNPGKIVDAPMMTENLRYGADYRAEEINTHFDFSCGWGISPRR